jgi:Mn-dependent DtxR family transcriptional regulator
MESLKLNRNLYNILLISGVDLRDYEALADQLEEVLKHSFTDKTKNSGPGRQRCQDRNQSSNPR